MLAIENLTLFRGQLCVADNISLQIPSGRTTAVLGPNGAGKSSLIQAVFGELPYQGKISFNGQLQQRAHLMRFRKTIGYMPQDNGVDASLTALEVVLLGQLMQLGLSISDEQLHQAIAMMESLGIAHLAQRDILSLSGGQRQMVMFAQAMQRKPSLLLLDEPVSALDMHHQCVLLEAVRQHTQTDNLTTVMILHDLSLAAQFADDIVLLADGKIQAHGDAKSVLQQEMIERLYHVEAAVYPDEYGVPLIAPRRALKTAINQTNPQ